MPRRPKATNGNGHAPTGGDGETPKRRGRPRAEQPPAPDEAGYTSEQYREFLGRIDDNTSDLNVVQADRRELLKAESNRGLNRVADRFVRSLRAKVKNDDMTLREAQSIIDTVNTLWDWTGLPLDLASEQRGRQEELETDPAI